MSKIEGDLETYKKMAGRSKKLKAARIRRVVQQIRPPDPPPDDNAVELLIALCGGVRAAAREMKCDPSYVSTWRRNGKIAWRYQKRAIELGLTPEQVVG